MYGGFVYYELVISIEHDCLNRTKLSSKKRAQYYSGHENIIFLHDNVRHMLRRTSKTTWKHSISPTTHPYSPDIIPSDDHFFQPSE